jgi:hypothetical protein
MNKLRELPKEGSLGMAGRDLSRLVLGPQLSPQRVYPAHFKNGRMRRESCWHRGRYRRCPDIPRLSMEAGSGDRA